MRLEENKLLAPFTTFGIGGPARWFVEASSEADVVEAISLARERELPLFVLGGGSNLLIADSGFNGIVLHIALCGIEKLAASDRIVYRVAAGENWDRFVQRTVKDDCAGLECLAGIPGTVGGTPVQNVGAYGQEVANSIETVRAYDLTAQAFVELSAAGCEFSYRRSRFNTRERGLYVVTRVDYRLTAGGSPTIDYADVQREFSGRPTPSLTEVAEGVRLIRQAKG